MDDEVAPIRVFFVYYNSHNLHLACNFQTRIVYILSVRKRVSDKQSNIFHSYTKVSIEYSFLFMSTVV